MAQSNLKQYYQQKQKQQQQKSDDDKMMTTDKSQQQQLKTTTTTTNISPKKLDKTDWLIDYFTSSSSPDLWIIIIYHYQIKIYNQRN